MKVWISKYALTLGVYEAEAEDCFKISSEMVKVGSCQYFHGSDWHYNQAEAMAKAEKMRLTKIASLKKSLAKFEAMRFV